jgi:hypothetical protein
MLFIDPTPFPPNEILDSIERESCPRGIVLAVPTLSDLDDNVPWMW